MSTFDPASFLSRKTDKVFDANYTPIPAGEYEAMIDGVDAQEINDQPVLLVTWLILDEGLKTEMNLDRITVRQSIFCEMDSDGDFAEGSNRNLKLGALRSAVGQSDTAQWSADMLLGTPTCVISVVQKPANDGNTYANVARVRAA